MKNEVFTKGKKVYVGIEANEWIALVTKVDALVDSAAALVDHVSGNDDIKSMLLVTYCRRALTNLTGLQRYMHENIRALSEDLETANKNKEEC